MRLGQKIAALHKKNHLFQEALAEKMNVSRQAPKKKLGRKIMNKYATLYWLIAVLLYLGYNFITNDWERSWIIWQSRGSYMALSKKSLVCAIMILQLNNFHHNRTLILNFPLVFGNIFC